MEFAKSLNEEERRTIAEELSEEELAVFDLLTKPEIDLTKSERKQVKKVARELLAVLKREKLVLDGGTGSSRGLRHWLRPSRVRHRRPHAGCWPSNQLTS